MCEIQIGMDSEFSFQKIRNCLQKGLENPLGLVGTVTWVVTDISKSISIRLVVDIGNCLVSEWSTQESLSFDARIEMPLKVFEYLATNIHNVDYRDSFIMGQTQITGDLILINHLVKALLIPGEENLRRMEFATDRKTPAYSIRSITRIHNPSELNVLEFIASGTPFIATGTNMFSSGAPWTLEELSLRFGALDLRTRSSEDRETVTQFVHRLSVYLKGDSKEPMVEGFTKPYTEGCALPPAMWPDFVPPWFSLDEFIAPQIWLGAVPRDVPASSLHRDPLDGFLFQFIGRKRLKLFSPDQAPYLYPCKAWNNYQPCWVDPAQARTDLFPEFTKAHPIEVILNPGEVLIQPAGWFHAVYCIDSPTFSVSYFLKH